MFLQYGFVKKAEHLWKGLSNNKTQISPIPPEGYGDRFVKFITGLTMAKEEVERETQSGDQRDGSMSTNRQITRSSTDKVVSKAELQAQKTVIHGASEDVPPEKTLSTLRRVSAEKPNGVPGATLPVVEEAGEAGSREDSMRNEKSPGLSAAHDCSSPMPSNNVKSFEEQRPEMTVMDSPTLKNELPSIPHISRISMTSALGVQA